MLYCGSPQAIIVLQCLVSLPFLSSAAQTIIPFALVVPPSQMWEGNDGPWSSFSLQVGSPAQDSTVLISTASNRPLVVLPDGCPSGSFSTCGSNPGGLFDPIISSTWTDGNFTAQEVSALERGQNLDYSINTVYGTETVALSSSSRGTTSLSDQLIGGIASTDLFIGSLGLNPVPTNFSNSNTSISSYMSNLKSQNKIPSLSYGYTAGNQYRFNKVLGSLTLGGYDASLIESNNLTVTFNGQETSGLTINVNTVSFSSGSDKRSLSTSTFSAVVDSSVPYLSLPFDVCQRFEDAFGITYDYESELYLVNDTLHSQLLEQAANVTFTLTNITSQVLVDITLPYQAFDLIADPPLVNTTTRYFPLKKAKVNSQPILGRTFLQEAYLIADYSSSTFSISQRNWGPTADPDIRTILPPSSPLIAHPSPPTTDPAPIPSSSAGAQSKPSTTTIIAAAVGGTCLLILLSVLLGYITIYRQRNPAPERPKDQYLYEPEPAPAPAPESEPKPAPAQVSRPISPRYHTAIRSPNYTMHSELASIGNLIRSPDVEGVPSIPMLAPAQPATRNSRVVRSTHELPGDEPVQEMVGSPVWGRKMGVERREVERRAFEDYRRRVQWERRSRRDGMLWEIP